METRILTLLLISTIFCIGLVSAQTLNTSEYATGAENEFGYGNDGYIGQTITIGNVGVAENVDIKILEIKGSKSGANRVYTVGLWDTSTGVPNTILTENSTFASEKLGTSSGWYNITLEGYTMQNGVEYAIIMNATGDDGSNRINWQRTAGVGAYGGGAYYNSTDGSTWVNNSADDLIFRIWGVISQSGTGTVETISPSNLEIVYESYVPFYANLTSTIEMNSTNITLYLWNSTMDLINTDTNLLTGSGENSTFWNLTSFSNGFNYTWNAFGCVENQTSTVCDWDSNKTFYYNPRLTFNVLDSLSSFITNIILEISAFSITTTDNPYTDKYWTDLNCNATSNCNINTTITDLTYENQDGDKQCFFNVTNSFTCSLTLLSNRISLLFRDNNGASKLVNGTITDTANQTARAFNDTSVLIVHSELGEGIINVEFNNLGFLFPSNMTQFYEYENVQAPNVSESLKVLTAGDVTSYFRVLDTTRTPISKATMRLYCRRQALADIVFNNTILIGQRLSDDQGYSKFYTDSGDNCIMAVTKSGYQPSTKQFNLEIETDAYAQAGAIEFILDEDSSNVDQNRYLYINRYFNNETTSIAYSIIGTDASKVEVTTNYREGLGLGNRTLSQDTYGFWRGNLIKSTDFGEATFNMSIFIDNTLWQEVEIVYDNTRGTSAFDFSDITVEKGILNVLGVILLIFMATLIGTFFRGGGFTTFMLGSILLSLVSTSFMFLSLTCGLYYIMGALRRVMEE